MKVLLVAGEFPPMQGGVGGFTRCLARGLSREGCRVTVYAPAACSHTSPHRGGFETRPYFPTREGGREVKLPTPAKVEGVGDGFAVEYASGGWSWRDLCRLARFCGHGFDVVNLQYQAGMYGMRLPVHFLPRVCRWLQMPLVVTFHDLRLPYLFPKAGPLRMRVVRWLLEGSIVSVVTNEEDLAAVPVMAPRARVRLVRIGSNVEAAPCTESERLRLRRQWGCGDGATVVCYFGFLSATKGALDLVQALALLRQRGEDVWLLFIGGLVGSSDASSAACVAQVQSTVEALGLRGRVLYTGYLDDDNVSAAFGASDICVLPYRDGASYRRGSLMAALAHGMPIVTTTPAVQISGLSEGKNVLLAAPGDVPDLADKMAGLAHDPSERKRLAEAAKVLAQGFTWDSIARDTIAVYREAMQRAG